MSEVKWKIHREEEGFLLWLFKMRLCIRSATISSFWKFLKVPNLKTFKWGACRKELAACKAQFSTLLNSKRQILKPFWEEVSGDEAYFSKRPNSDSIFRAQKLTEG